MSDWNVRRKARGRIRQARQRRRRQRVTAVSALVLLCLSALAIGAVNYGKKENKKAEIAKYNNSGHALPRISPVIARAEAPKPDTNLPPLLNVNERFPDYDERPSVPKRDDSNGDEEEIEEPDESPARKMVILDDLSAAPPKSLFIKAVFENRRESPERKKAKSRRWLHKDFSDGNDDIFGKKKKKKKKPKDPPIPEPGTGILLGLGLIGLAGARRAERKQRRLAGESLELGTNEGHNA